MSCTIWAQMTDLHIYMCVYLPSRWRSKLYLCVYIFPDFTTSWQSYLYITQFHYGYTFNISRLRNVNLILLVILVFSQFIVSVKTISIILTGLSFIWQGSQIFTWQWSPSDLYLTMKSEWASCMMSFSERMCSCCLVSTMWRFLRIFMAYVLDSSLFSWTCTTRQTDGQIDRRMGR